MEALYMRLIIHGLVQCTNHRITQGKRDIPNSHTVQMRSRMRALIGCGFLRYPAEQV